MNQNLRLLLALSISLVIVTVYTSYFAPQPVATDLTEQQSQTTTEQTQKPTELNPTTATPFVDPEFKPAAKTLSIKTAAAVYTLDTQGAKIISTELNHYNQTVKKNSPAKNILNETPESAALLVELEGYTGLASNSVFDVVSESKNAKGQSVVTLAWQDLNLRLEKTFTFGEGSDYGIKTQIKIINRSNHAYTLTPKIVNQLGQKNLPKIQGFLDKLTSAQPDPFLAHVLQNDKFESPTDLQNQPAMNLGNVSWNGFADRYFLVGTGLNTDSPIAGSSLIRQNGETLVAEYSIKALNLNPQQSLEQEFLSYVGPKENSALTAMAIPFSRSVDYGWFSFIARGILKLMMWIHAVIPSWGLVIITLTLMVKLILHPINQKSMASMKNMQLLQPKLAEIRKRYADDQNKQNQEVMQLFRTHGVNPMSGCLPLLLQMPIYVALYKVLYNAIELYHAPFMWYRDMSAPDPLFIAPILLGVAMFLQQKLTPTSTTDPAQQKMMMFMPILFTGFMLFLPIGLVIYIFVNTMISVVQQYMLRNDLKLADLLKGKFKANLA